MSQPLVYLCGTITTDLKYLTWRADVQAALAPEIGVLSPIRGKDVSDWRHDGLTSIQPTIYSHGGFVPRDLRDLECCDAVLLVFLDRCERQSIGTWFEFGWASRMGKPVVVVSSFPEVVEHPFVWRTAARVCPTLDEGIAYLRFLFYPPKASPCSSSPSPWAGMVGRC